MSGITLEIAATLIKAIIIIFALLTVFAYMTLVERRVIARFQSRLGPNRAGPLGILQPLADALKMAFKEQIIPSRAKVFVYMMAPCLSIFVALSAFAVVPLGEHLGGLPSAWNPLIADVNIGILYVLSISSLAVYGIVLGGWASGNRYSLLGALRSAAQMVSYEVSIAISLSGVLMVAGTLSMVGIVHAQNAHTVNGMATPGVWFILAQPLGFVLYFIAATAEVNRAPFDLPEAEQELVAGYLTEFSGLRWSLYQMAEYTNMIVVSSVAATLFLGGWTLGGLDGVPGMPILWYAIKVGFFLFVFIWMRATLPRIRYDQLMKFGWQVLLPLSVLNLIVTALAVINGWDWYVTGIFGLVALIGAGSIVYQRVLRPARPKSDPAVGLPASVRLVHVETQEPVKA
jgi:NADH-quinone oxidoreductase subunit H